MEIAVRIFMILVFISFFIGQMWIVMIVWRQGRLLGSLCFIPLVAIFFGLFYYKEDTKYPFLIMAISGAIILFYAFVMEGSPTGT